MDVAILAGGLGTRLRGVWDGPKCLVPIAGRPVLFRLLDQVRSLHRAEPGRITLLLGHGYWGVLGSLANFYRSELHLCVVASPPKGTAAALREALPGLQAPLLVLNGDTLPLFPLEGLAIFYGVRQRSVAAICEGRFAGACIFGPEKLSEIQKTDNSSLDAYVSGLDQYRVPGFLDIGTPESFFKAQHLKGDEL